MEPERAEDDPPSAALSRPTPPRRFAIWPLVVGGVVVTLVAVGAVLLAPRSGSDDESPSPRPTSIAVEATRAAGAEPPAQPVENPPLALAPDAGSHVPPTGNGDEETPPVTSAAPPPTCPADDVPARRVDFEVCVAPEDSSLLGHRPATISLSYAGEVRSARRYTGKGRPACDGPRVGHVDRRRSTGAKAGPRPASLVLDLRSSSMGAMRVVVDWPERLPMPRAGDPASVSLRALQQLGFGTSSHHLELKVGALRVGASAGGGPFPRAALLGVAFEAGGPVCKIDSQCGVSTRHSVRARFPGEDSWHTVPRQTGLSRGRTWVRVSSSSVFTRDRGRCPDHDTGGHGVLVWSSG